MLVVIFGAGASYDSDWRRLPPADGALDTYNRPPLTKDLFHDMYKTWMIRNRPAQGLIEDLQGGHPIETRLEKFREEAKTRPARRRQLAAVQLYLQGVLSTRPAAWYEDCSGRTNYTRLLQRIEDWRVANQEEVCLVTFNYDTLLERACDGVGLGLRLETISGYIQGEGYGVIRLHGSADWFLKVGEPYTEQMRQSGQMSQSPFDWTVFLTEAAAARKISGSLMRIPEVDDRPTGHFPAIAIPTETKTDSDFICPVAHLQKLLEALGKMTRLLVVGWRGREEHFYQLWRGLEGYGQSGRPFPPSLQRLLVVDAGDEAGGTVLTNLSKYGGLSVARYAVITSGFSGCLKHSSLDEFLS